MELTEVTIRLTPAMLKESKSRAKVRGFTLEEYIEQVLIETIADFVSDAKRHAKLKQKLSLHGHIVDYKDFRDMSQSVLADAHRDYWRKYLENHPSPLQQGIVTMPDMYINFISACIYARNKIARVTHMCVKVGGVCSFYPDYKSAEQARHDVYHIAKLMGA